jgi:hypothetical protein
MMFEFEYGAISSVLPLSFFRLENHVYLFRGVHVVGAEDQGCSHKSDTRWPNHREVG